MSHVRSETEPTLSDFLDLVRQPGSQPTMARLLDEWFGYSLSGSFASTEVRSVVCEVVDLESLFRRVQNDTAHRMSLRVAVNAARK